MRGRSGKLHLVRESGLSPESTRFVKIRSYEEDNIECRSRAYICIGDASQDAFEKEERGASRNMEINNRKVQSYGSHTRMLFAAASRKLLSLPNAVVQF